MIRVDFYPNPLDRKHCVAAEVAPDQTLDEILGGDYRDKVSVLSNGHIVPKPFYSKVRFKDESHIEVMPAANGLEVGALIAVAIGLGTSTAAAVAVTVTINVLAGLALGLLSSLLFAPKIPGQGSASKGFDSLNQFTGTANQIAAFTPIPKLFGRHRFYPVIPVSALNYTETEGDNSYLRALFVLSHGRMDIGGHMVGAGHPKITQDTPLDDVNGHRPLQIGGTDIAEFDDCEYEIGTSDQITLYSDQVIETDPAFKSESNADDYGQHDNPTVIDNIVATRTSEADAEEISIDLTGNIYTIDTKGDFRKLRVEYQIEWRKTGGTGAWQSDTFTMRDNNGKTRFQSYRIKNLAKAQYDVRLTRLSTYFSNLEGPPASEVTWSALRTIRKRKAFDVPDVVVMAIRIRATDQLKGRLDKLSVEGTAVLPVFDVDANAWADEPTRNPAWAFAEVLTGQANRSPISKSALDLNEIVAWAYDCEQYDLNFDVVYDNQQTTIDRLKEITSVGRAAFSINSDNDISVIRDVNDAPPRMVISPRNSFGYSYTLSAFNPPQALKVRYKDAGNRYETAERIVYDDGEDVSTATKTTALQSIGCTSAEQAYKFGRYHLANQRLRGIEVHQFSMDVQHLHFVRGDTVTLQNDQILVGLAAGRIKSVNTNSSGKITGFVSDEFLPMASAQYACKFQQGDGTIFVAPVQTHPGTEVVFLSPLDRDIEADDHFVFGETGRISTDLKIVKIEKKNDLQAAITCEPAAPHILDAIDGPIPDFDPNITTPIDPENYPPPQPSILSVISDNSVAIKNDDGSLIWRVAVNVKAKSGSVSTDRIQVGVRRSDAPDATFDNTNARDGVAYFTGYNPGDLIDIRARAVSESGQPSKYVIQLDYTVTGRVPPKPTAINITRHTFSADFDPLGGDPASVYEFFLSGTALAAADILTQATRLNQQATPTFTATGLQPDTPYVVHARAVNIYAASAFVSAAFTTRNDPTAQLKLYSQEINATQLAGTLFEPIPRIDGDGPGSVNDRLAAEALARTQALEQEAINRVNGIGEETEQRLAADGALTRQNEQLNSRFTAVDFVLPPGEGESPPTVGLTNEGRILRESLTRADETGALATTTEVIQARIQALKLEGQYGFETGTPGAKIAPKGWGYEGPRVVQTGYSETVDQDSAYGSLLSYGHDGEGAEPGAWGLIKTFYVDEGGADFSVSVQTRIVAGHAYALLIFFDADAGQIGQVVSEERATGFDGELLLTYPLPEATRFVRLHLRASSLTLEG